MTLVYHLNKFRDNTSAAKKNFHIIHRIFQNMYQNLSSPRKWKLVFSLIQQWWVWERTFVASIISTYFFLKIKTNISLIILIFTSVHHCLWFYHQKNTTRKNDNGLVTVLYLRRAEYAISDTNIRNGNFSEQKSLMHDTKMSRVIKILARTKTD